MVEPLLWCSHVYCLPMPSSLFCSSVCGPNTRRPKSAACCALRDRSFEEPHLSVGVSMMPPVATPVAAILHACLDILTGAMSFWFLAA